MRDMTILTPGNWFEIPLPSTLTDEEIAERVQQRAGAFPGLNEVDVQRGVEAGAAACRELGTVWAAMMLELIDGHPLIATAAVSVTDTGRWESRPSTAEEIARELAVDADDGTWDILTGTLPAGYAARVWHLTQSEPANGSGPAGALSVTFYIPIPDTMAVVTFACFSPNVDIAEPLTAQFDVMATSLRFTD